VQVSCLTTLSGHAAASEFATGSLLDAASGPFDTNSLLESSINRFCNSHRGRFSAYASVMWQALCLQPFEIHHFTASASVGGQ
jgi:hypothetical protein